MAVYDPEDKNKDLNSLTPNELGDMEDKYSTRKDEREDNAIEDGADEEKQKRGGMGRKLRKHGEDAEDEEKQSLEDKLSKGFNDAMDEDVESALNFVNKKDKDAKKGKSKKQTKISRGLKNKWVRGGAVAGGVGLVTGVLALFSFLNIFKLDQLLSNIDAKAFGRFNATFSNRSDKWMRAYIQLRLTEIGGSIGNDTLIFRANKVDTNNPIRDWYRTLRTSNFEKDLFEKQGIYFTSIAVDDGVGDGGVVFRSAEINIDGHPELRQRIDAKLGGESLTSKQIKNGQLTNILSQVTGELDTDTKNSIVRVFDNDKSTRARLKEAANLETRFLSVIKRRHVRKDIQNMIGVSDWKFFEKTRTKLTDKKIEVQKKLLRKLLPEDTKAGKYLLCIFGAGRCSKNADAVNEETQSSKAFESSGTESEGDKPATDDQGNVQTDKDGKVINQDVGTNAPVKDAVNETITDFESKLEDDVTGKADEFFEKELRSELLSNIMKKINIVTTALSIVQTMDILSRIDSNLVGGKLTQVAVLAKGAQAAAAYTTYETMRSQTKSTELTSDEYNIVMNGIKGYENSEAYDYFFNQPSGKVSAATSKEAFCDDTHVPVEGEYFWNCDKTKIGGKTNGTKIETMYMNSIGKIFHPIASDYRHVRNRPGIKQLFDFAGWLSNWVSGLVAKLTDPILDAIGVTGSINRVLAFFTDKVTSFLGAGPILTGFNDLAGLTLTMIGQGAAYVSESSTRDSGAAISNPVSQAYANKIALQYQDDEIKSQSLSTKYFAISNPDSVASKALTRLSSTNLDSMLSIKGWFGNVLGNLGSLMSGRLSAATNAGAASFAGIDSYDFAPYCIDRDPLDMAPPADLTNADTVLNSEGKPFIDAADITLDLLDDSRAFWAKAYERVGDNDTDPQTILQVYNCETLDQRVRGGLGFTSGYDKDNGLEDGVVGASP